MVYLPPEKYEKYESQIGSSSQLLGKIKNVPNHQPVNDKAFFSTMCIVSPRNLVTQKKPLNSSNDVEKPYFLPWLLRVCLIRGMGCREALAMRKFRQAAGFFLGYPDSLLPIVFRGTDCKVVPQFAKSRSVGEHNSKFILVYGRCIYTYYRL